jgi:hypothetical protein
MMTEFEIIKSLDFEFQPECDGAGCDQTAVWKGIASCCERMILACEDDHTLLVAGEDYAGFLIDKVCDDGEMNLFWERI